MSEVIRVGSSNNNVFHYCSYWRTWSRILFHDSGGRGMLKMREEFNIPDSIKTIEVDLTAVNNLEDEWKRVSDVNIRCHSTDIKREDLIVGSIDPQEIGMSASLPIRTISLLLHADYLPYLDFSKYVSNKGGTPFIEMAKEVESLERYAAVQRSFGGPGVGIDDVREDYNKYIVPAWNNRIKILTP